MKSLILLMIFFHPLYIIAQDEIELKDGTVQSVRIVQEEKKEIHFYHAEDPEKEIITLPKKQIRKVRYQDIPKNTNVIRLIMDSLGDDDLFAGVVRYLLQAGYPIGTINNDAHIMESDYQNKHRITIEVERNEVEFIAFYTELEINYPPKGEVVWGKDSEPEEYRIRARNARFKIIDELCRRFLKEYNGELVYDQK